MYRCFVTATCGRTYDENLLTMAVVDATSGADVRCDRILVISQRYVMTSRNSLALTVPHSTSFNNPCGHRSPRWCIYDYHTHTHARTLQLV